MNAVRYKGQTEECIMSFQEGKEVGLEWVVLIYRKCAEERLLLNFIKKKTHIYTYVCVCNIPKEKNEIYTICVDLHELSLPPISLGEFSFYISIYIDFSWINK